MNDRVVNKSDSGVRGVAFENLRQVLDKKKRGDRITAAEVRDATGFQQWGSFRNRIKKYLEKQGLHVQAVPNDGYRIVAAREHVDVGEKERRRSMRADAAGLRALDSAPVAELSEAELRRLEFVRSRAQQRVRTAMQHENETRKELGAGARQDRVHLRVLST